MKRTYSEPHWSKKRAVGAWPTSASPCTAYPLVADRAGRLSAAHEPDVARELFIRHALVQGEWHTRHRFFETNRRLLEEAEELEHRARRRDIVVDEETLFDFYDARVPGRRHLRRPLRHLVEAGAPRPGPTCSTFDPVDARPRPRPTRCGPTTSPTSGTRAPPTLPLRYHFEPGHRGRRRHDRRTAGDPEHRRRRAVHLERARPAPGPGHRADPVAAQAAPGQLRAGARRRPAVPRRRCRRGRSPSSPALSRYLRSLTGVHVPEEAWDPAQGARPPAADVPGRSTSRVRGRCRARTSRPSSSRCARRSTGPSGRLRTSPGCPRPGRPTWTFGTIEPSFTQTRAGHEVHGFPTLVDEGSTVGLRVAASADEQEAQPPARRTPAAVAGRRRRRRAAARVARQRRQAALAASPYPNVRALVEDCVAGRGRASSSTAGTPVRDPEAFAALRRAVRAPSFRTPRTACCTR